MARTSFIQVCALNISANPHPDGIYLDLLRRASSYLTQARGTDYAKITLPRISTPNGDYYTGRILVWTEIDLKGSWIDLNNNEELHRSLKEEIQIPDNAKPNFRAFNYAFNKKKHILYFEFRNEIGQSIGPTTARRIFSSLLSQDIQGISAPDVSVTILPEDGAVERILSLDKLKTLQISVQLPNADTTSPAKKRVIERLRKNHATRLDETYTKASGADSLTPTPDVYELAEIAAEDGFVRGVGRGENGRRLEISTDQYPARYYVNIEEGSSLLTRLLSALRDR